jgi:hypothetical protein
VQRAVWDLRYEPPKKAKPAKLDFGWPDFGPKALPGTYTLRLLVDGKTYTERLVVDADPRLRVAPQDAEAQLRFTLELRDEINGVTRLIEAVRNVRRQVAVRAENWRTTPNGTPLARSSDAVLAKLDTLEARMHNPRAEVVYDILAQPGGTKLYSRLTPLYLWAVVGDGAPTQGMREVYADQKRELDGLEGELRALVTGDMAALNRQARELNLADIPIPASGVR